MAFVQPREYARIAIDTTTQSQVVIKSTPEIETLIVEFTSPEASLETAIYIKRKFPDQPIVANDPRNPGVMIAAGNLNHAFAAQRMLDVQVNTALAERLVRMIAFLSRHSPISTVPFLWSDYDKLRSSKLLYRMPSNQELLKLSIDPEAELPKTGGL